MHFPTDVLLGIGVGAATGILVPHLHKIALRKQGVSILPFVGSASGVAVHIKI